MLPGFLRGLLSSGVHDDGIMLSVVAEEMLGDLFVVVDVSPYGVECGKHAFMSQQRAQ